MSRPYHIVYAASDAYSFLAGVSLLSLFDNNRHLEDIRIYILDDHIRDENKAGLRQIAETYGRSITFQPVEDVISTIRQTGTGGYGAVADKGFTTFSRLTIGDVLPEADRVLFIDSDTMVNGDIRGLYEYDMHGMPIAMAIDCLQNRYKEYIGLKPYDRYCNAGILLVDMQEWIKRDCFERIMHHLSHIRNDYPLVDQDLLNVVLGKECCPFPMRYNYLSQYYLYDYDGNLRVYDQQENANNGAYWTREQWLSANNALREAVIFHFSGGTMIRPWYTNSRHPMRESYRRYYAMSPWKNRPMTKAAHMGIYYTQYWLSHYTPRTFNVSFSRLMQKMYMRKTYGL